MSPLERLLAEAIPVRPEPAPGSPAREHAPSVWSREQQDAHWLALCRAVGTPDAQRPHEQPHARRAAA